MRGRIIAAMAAGLLVLGLGAVAAGALRSERMVEVTSRTAAVQHETSDGIEALLQLIEALIQELRAAYSEHLNDQDGTLRPLEDGEDETDEQDVAAQDSASDDEGEPGCAVEHDSGDGWNRTEVRCYHEEVTRNGGSISISSSSSSTTTTSSSN